MAINPFTDCPRCMKSFKECACDDKYEKKVQRSLKGSRKAVQQAMAAYKKMRARVGDEELKTLLRAQAKEQMEEMYKAQLQYDSIVAPSSADNDINIRRFSSVKMIAEERKEEIKQLRSELAELKEQLEAQRTDAMRLRERGSSGDANNSSSAAVISSPYFMATTTAYIGFVGRGEPEPPPEPAIKKPPPGEVPNTDLDDIVMKHPLMDDEE